MASLIAAPFLMLALAAPAATSGPGAAFEATCPTGPISAIFIDNRSIFDLTDPELDERVSWAYRLANALHYRTRRSVIRRELLFRPGDCYDEWLLAESERLLRATDYISRVDVYGIQQEDGSYHVLVDTQDEWSTKVDLRLRFQDGVDFEGIRLRETNLLGTGQTLGFFHQSHRAERQYGAFFHTHQLAGSRWDLRTALSRTLAGTAVRQTLMHPFIGEVGRWSSLHSFRREDRYFDYLAEAADGGEFSVLLPVRDKGLELALLSRIGRPGRFTVLGGGISYQQLAYPAGVAGALVVGQGGFAAATPPDSAMAALLAGQLRELSNTRVSLLLGQRSIGYVKRRGLDSMRGEQDVELGAEANVVLGRSLPSLERDNDLTVALGLSAGAEVGPLIFAARARGDGRRDLDAPPAEGEWSDLLFEGEFLTYLRAARHTVVGRLSMVGGWNTKTPFQVTLGGDHGLRAYRVERFPGAHRLVGTLEDRVFLGWPFAHVLDLGATAFVDVGRVWAGDVPFGSDSGWRTSVGLGLRASFPPAGRNTYRLDLAVPIEQGLRPGNVRVTLSLQEILGLSAPRIDPQMLRSRPGIPPEGVAFPN
jgi:hypothetical protein